MSLSRTSSVSSLASIFSTPANYDFLPADISQLRASLSELALPDTGNCDWETIATALADVLYDPHYKLRAATYMAVHAAVWNIIYTSNGVEESPHKILRQSIELFLQHYLAGLAEIATGLALEDKTATEQFVRQRRARYLQAGRWASHMFSVHDRSFIRLKVQPWEKVKAVRPRQLGEVFSIEWSKSGLPAFDVEEILAEGEGIENEAARNDPH